MKAIYFILLVSIFLSNCNETEVVEPTPIPVIPIEPTSFQSDSLSYLALGDSYTIGQYVAINERFPIQLGNSLTADTFKIKEVKIIAQTGWTTANLQQGIAQETGLQSKYDLVSLLIGVNNQYQGGNVADYEIEFRQLLQQAIGFADNNANRVFVVSIPDYAFTPFGNGNTTISQQLDDFNAANKAITAQYNIQYFDITPISREGLNEPSLVASDGLHPSGEQYRQWVALMLDDVKAMLVN